MPNTWLLVMYGPPKENAMSRVTLCCKSTKQCGKMAACLNTVEGDQKRIAFGTVFAQFHDGTVALLKARRVSCGSRRALNEDSSCTHAHNI